MGESNRGKVVLHFGDGSTIDSWVSFSCRETWTDPIGHLEFDASPPRNQVDDYRRRLAKGELVTLLVNDANQGSYIIESSGRTISPNGGVHFKPICKTPLVTPYQGDVDPEIAKRFKDDAPVLDVILEALAPYGFTQIVGDSNANVTSKTGKPLDKGAAPLSLDPLKHRDIQAQYGETAYTFCSRIFSRFGVALRMAADGTLVLEAPDYDQAPGYGVVQGSGEGDPTIGDITIEDTNDGQFSHAIVRGQAPDSQGEKQSDRPDATVLAYQWTVDMPAGSFHSQAEFNAALASSLAAIKARAAKTKSPVTTLAEVNASGRPGRPAYTSFAASYKPKFILDKGARDQNRCESVGALALGAPAAKAFVVNCEVDGLVARTGRIWTVGTMCHTKIDIESLDENMFLLERTLVGDAKNDGQKTRLKLVPSGAIVLGKLPPKTRKR